MHPKRAQVLYQGNAGVEIRVVHRGPSEIRGLGEGHEAQDVKNALENWHHEPATPAWGARSTRRLAPCSYRSGLLSGFSELPHH